MEAGSASCAQRAGGPQPCTHEELGALPTGAASSTAPRCSSLPSPPSGPSFTLAPLAQSRERCCVGPDTPKADPRRELCAAHSWSPHISRGAGTGTLSLAQHMPVDHPLGFSHCSRSSDASSYSGVKQPCVPEACVFQVEGGGGDDGSR